MPNGATRGGRVQKYLLQKRFVAPNSLPPLVGAGLGVGAREPHRSLPASGTSGGFLDPMGASDFDPAAFRAQARFLRTALVRRFPGLCFSRVTSVPRIPAQVRISGVARASTHRPRFRSMTDNQPASGSAESHSTHQSGPGRTGRALQADHACRDAPQTHHGACADAAARPRRAAHRALGRRHAHRRTRHSHIRRRRQHPGIDRHPRRTAIDWGERDVEAAIARIGANRNIIESRTTRPCAHQHERE